MALQGIWSGTVSFSLVAIPVRLVPAIKPENVSFHLLHNKDHARLARTMFCPEEKTSVPRDELARGFEIVPGKYVLMTDEELEAVTPERSRTIEIIEFVDVKELDPVYYDHPYYLAPLKGGEKAYQLLAEVLQRTNRAGIAKFVLADREHLVAIMSRQGALALTTLHYSGEILPDQDLAPRRAADAVADEPQMRADMERLIVDFAPGKYADGRRKRIKDLLAQKAKDHAVVESPAAPEEAGEGPVDLIAALEESMQKMKSR